ncbi:CTP-dependent riboflavin kinase [Halobacterium salinarum]|uniref:CTP-dependent riboflavin kinase n=1 Tax=Halobacterium salinarum TaxID=2242 RepID=UPI001F38674A|nr:CTP-dependent riboflavin kinase [Halobacterium salinarum]MCF2239532.1 CTP-dependent riboflavin kinase [Halobacterium salinarum]
MSGATSTGDVGYDELAVLKLLALDGAHRGEVKVSCGDLASRLDASSQTASRRLQALDDANHVTRDLVSDGQWITVTDAGRHALKHEYEDYRRIFEDPGELALAGTVTSGMGEGRHYISLPGYNRQFAEKLGYEPYPGTLNVDLPPDGQRARAGIQALDGVDIDAWEDEDRTYGSATCYACTVVGDGTDFDGAHVIIPDRTHHDDDQLEIIAPVKLRERLGLLDDDEVTIRVEA